MSSDPFDDGRDPAPDDGASDTEDKVETGPDVEAEAGSDAAPAAGDGGAPLGSDPSGDTGGRQRFHRRVFDRARRRARVLVRSRAFWVIVGLFLLASISWQRCGIRGCPNVARLASYQPGGASVLLDRDGKPFADLGPVDHSVVEIESLPAHVPAAFIAVEDKRFHRHDGVDWRRVVGAAVANIRQGRKAQGSSTITMQLSRNLFPERIRAADRTFRRKLLEVRVSRDIERRFSKDEILELYLNHIYFGAGAYGIEAAAKQYFGRPAKELTLEQAAVLAALPKAPSNYDPRRHAERARARRDLVIGLMAAQGHITQERADRARTSPLRTSSPRASREPTQRASWFTQVVRDMLEDRLGEDVYSRPLRIRTTIDMRAQRAAEEELEAQLRRVENGAYGRFTGPRMASWEAGSGQTDYLQGAAVLIDNATGDVLALVGGRNARHSSFNRAIAAKRQTGSAFKPFVFAAALSRGHSPIEVLDDSPYRLVSNGEPWEPRNYDGEFLGPITMRDALVFSRNVPTIRLASDVGERHVARLARSAGIRAELIESPVIALGVAEVSPLELTAAYSAFSGQGVMVEPRFVLRVEDADGNVLWEPEVRSHEVLDPAVAYVMTDMMRDAVNRGTGRGVRSAGYRGTVAGKTGTTNDGTDNWFVGYTPRVTGGVWVGFDRPRQIAANASGSVAAWVWGRTMNRIASWADGDAWRTPDRVVRVSVDPETGLALADGCLPDDGEPRTEVFLTGTAPRESCPERANRRDRRDRRSVLDRIVAWAGGIFDRDPNDAGRQRVAVAEENRRSRDDDRTTRSRSSRERDRRIEPLMPPEPHLRGDRDLYGWSERRGENEPDEWSENVEDALRDAIEARREQERRAIEWLRELGHTVEHRLHGDEAERLGEWIDDAIRTIERAARDARRNDRDRADEWLDELRRNQRQGRRRTISIESDAVRRALSALERDIALSAGQR